MRYILFLTILMFGCDSTERERDRVEMTDAASMDARVPIDGLLDLGPIGDVDVLIDEPNPDADGGAPVMEELTPEDLCDNEDDDGDGRVDEGVANPCGGCGGIPPGGCQYWRIQLVADGEGLLSPRSTVGLAASFLGVSAVEVPNGECLIQRLRLTQSRDQHLGRVTLERDEERAVFTPEFDADVSAVLYQNDVMGDWLGLSDGERVDIQAEGGEDILLSRSL